MTTYLEQLELARKAATHALEDAAKKGSVKLIAEAQLNLEKVDAALSSAKAS